MKQKHLVHVCPFNGPGIAQCNASICLHEPPLVVLNLEQTCFRSEDVNPFGSVNVSPTQHKTSISLSTSTWESQQRQINPTPKANIANQSTGDFQLGEDLANLRKSRVPDWACFGLIMEGKSWYRNFIRPRVPSRPKNPYLPVGALRQPSLWSLAVRVFILSTPPKNSSTPPPVFYSQKPSVIFVSRSIFFFLFLLHFLFRTFPLPSIRSTLLSLFSQTRSHTPKMPGVVSPLQSGSHAVRTQADLCPIASQRFRGFEEGWPLAVRPQQEEV